MRIGGLQKVSLIDYPGKIAAVVFTQGCMFRCKYCHNAELVIPSRFTTAIDENAVMKYLIKSVGKLDGVVVSGGEPTLQRDLKGFIKKVKDLGYLIKLDTTGFFPQVIEDVLKENLLDFIAMDVKAPLHKYEVVTQQKVDSERIRKSIYLIMNSGIDYEFRTTIAKKLITPADVVAISNVIKGAKTYVLQKFVRGKTLDPKMQSSKVYDDEEFESMRILVGDRVQNCFVR